ncbi:hypothetical protein [Massilia sp. CFBP9026]|uniref:hypothetical protein n=1 Tax=Massilia sp. CFBP9026 TaxID=3096536 RepID=UPI002A69AA19|nr:hypothetical protein [Massilia sp. CFBP9026]MDY0962704.1 hypothetical protein [Massilia sp. CFBP9026]
MEALSRPAAASPTASGATANSTVVSGNTGAQSTSATGRAHAVPPLDADSRAITRTPPTSSPLRRGVGMNQNLQSEVARAQQALDYLARMASQLESLKADLSTRLSSRGAAASRDLEARVRQLTAALEGRRQQAGDGVDAALDFDAVAGAQQRFRIQGLNIATLRSGGTQTMGFSVGSAGGPQLAATIEPGMTPEEIAQRLDRTLAPVKVRAGLDQGGELVFTTRESTFTGIKDAIAVTGRGRVDTMPLPAALDPQNWELGNPDALRQSLREVVQALARVRRSQDAASLALSTAMARNTQPEIPSAELAMIAQDFTATAASHDYDSLLAITSALVGVSRDRVTALLGLR